MRIGILLASVMLAAATNVVHATTLLIGVDPATGESKFFIASGVANVNRESRTGEPTSGTTLDPNQQLDNSSGAAPLRASGADLNDLISNTSNAIIEAIIASKTAIDQENQEYIAKLQSPTGSGQESNQDAIDRINKNLDNLVGNIVKNALSQGKVDQSQIKAMIDRINEQLEKKLDLDNVKHRQLSEQEAARQAQIKLLEDERRQKREAEKNRQEQLKKQNQELQAKLKEQLERQQAEKVKAEEAAKKKAAEEAAKKLADDAAKAAFEAKQKALAEEKQKQAAQVDKAREAGLSPVIAGTPAGGGESGNETGGLAGGVASGNAPGTPGTPAGNEPGDQVGGPADIALAAPAADSRYDPNAPVDGDALRRLVNGSALPPMTPRLLANALRPAIAELPKQADASTTGDAAADAASKDKLLRQFVASVSTGAGTGSDYPHIAAGDVSGLPPTRSLTGDFTATYNGRMSGAFGDGTAVGASMSLDVNFGDRAFHGDIVFDGGNGKASVAGDWTTGVNSVSGMFHASEPVYGGEATGSLGGKFYGPKGQELGGNWSMNIHSGVREGQSGGGQFATKQ